jgi:hypothetical protein
VTEDQWLTCNNPGEMLAFLRTGANLSARKARLFGVAACRQIWHLLDDERSQKAVEAAEQFADGAISTQQLFYSHSVAYVAWTAAASARPGVPSGYEATDAAYEVAGEDVQRAATCAASSAARAVARLAASDTLDPAFISAREGAEREQASIFRDILGNPFCPCTITPVLLNETVVKIAHAIYHECAFEQMPILADALEENGCRDATVLAHCRADTPHARGCHVLDLILGRT